MFRHLHTADVKVELGDMKTQGIDQHIAAMEMILKQAPESRIVQHTPTVAAGNWTCVVGLAPGFATATVAKWRDGAICEEYLFMKQLPAGSPAPTGTTITSIENDGKSQALTGAEPGRACSVAARTASPS